jgi:hypothetical protein
MYIRLDSREIPLLFEYLGKKEWGELFKQRVIFSDYLEYKYKTVSITMQLQPSKDSPTCIEIDVVKAKWAGMGIFGVVRKKACQALIDFMNKIPAVLAWKMDNGNVGVKISNVDVQGIHMGAGNIIVTL